ncbi:hypothetical protein ABH927_001385 [Planotetraspora sp. GP83]
MARIPLTPQRVLALSLDQAGESVGLRHMLFS